MKLNMEDGITSPGEVTEKYGIAGTSMGSDCYRVVSAFVYTPHNIPK